MNTFLFCAVIYVWANLALQIFCAVNFGPSVFRVLMVVLGIACALVTTVCFVRRLEKGG